MTKYRLKDQELQKNLDEISGGSFTESLESIKKPSCIVFQARNGGPAMSVNLTKQDIEQFLEYDPNKWNKYPEVTPPEGVWMRVEQFSNNKVRRTAGIFRDGKWYGKHDVCDTYLDETLGNVTLFRPWE